MTSLRADVAEGKRLCCKQGKTLTTAGTSSGDKRSLQSPGVQDLLIALFSNIDSFTWFLFSFLSHHSAIKSHKIRNSSFCSKIPASWAD